MTGLNTPTGISASSESTYHHHQQPTTRGQCSEHIVLAGSSPFSSNRTPFLSRWPPPAGTLLNSSTSPRSYHVNRVSYHFRAMCSSVEDFFIPGISGHESLKSLTQWEMMQQKFDIGESFTHYGYRNILWTTVIFILSKYNKATSNKDKPTKREGKGGSTK